MSGSCQYNVIEMSGFCLAALTAVATRTAHGCTVVALLISNETTLGSVVVALFRMLSAPCTH